MSRTPVIHIGLPKTGTKTLQWRLFANHSEIYYLGRYDGPSFRKTYRRYQCCRDATVQALMQEIAYSRFHRPDFGRCADLAAEILAAASEGNLVPVWSWESYATDTLKRRQARARNLRRVFGQARILVTLRHPASLLESAFLQVLKRDNVGGGMRRYWPPYYCSVDEWMRRGNRDVRHHLDYGETIKAYVDLFGRGNVHVSLFEELREDATRFYTGMCAFVGVSASEGLALVQGHRDNTRWNQNQLDALAGIKNSLGKYLQFQFADKKRRKMMLGLDAHGVPVHGGPKAQVKLSEQWRQRILAETRNQHEWLMNTFELPLERYGYLG